MLDEMPEEFREENKPDGMLKAVRFSPMMHTDKRTPDGRLIKGDGFSVRELPLTFLAQLTPSFGHDGAVPVGRLDKVRQNGTARDGWGWYADTEEAAKAMFFMQTKIMKGVSVDLSAYQYEISVSPQGNLQIDFLKSALKGLTQVAFPAFPDAKGAMADWSDIAAAIATFPPYIDAPLEMMGITFTEETDLQAAGVVVPVGKAEHFARPTFEQATPFRATRDKHVFGHIALWGECHVGIEGRCVTPPRSRSNYSHFAKRCIPLSDGSDAWIGSMVLGKKHADPSSTWEEAQEWYSNACRPWADIAIGEDQFGIWVSGSVRDTATQADVTAGCRAGGSGHWKPRNGAPELFAVLSVNAEGYDVPRPKALSSMGELCDLQAAGFVAPEPQTESDLGALVSQFKRVGDFLEREANQREIERILANVRSS